MPNKKNMNPSRKRKFRGGGKGSVKKATSGEVSVESRSAKKINLDEKCVDQQNDSFFFSWLSCS